MKQICCHKQDGGFELRLLNSRWIDNNPNNREDLCLHGAVYVRIGTEVVAHGYDCTVSAAALYLLRSLQRSHAVGTANQLLPCCGHTMFAKTKNRVEIIGCPNGVDWSVTHHFNRVTLVTQAGTRVILSRTEYKRAVCRFADQVEHSYRQAPPRLLPADSGEQKAYAAFWREWQRRRFGRMNWNVLRNA